MDPLTPASKEETMQSNNPMFRRSEEFNRGGANLYGNQTYAGNGAPMAGYGQTTDPSQWSVGTPGDTGRAPRHRPRPMTIDSVVQKTAITLGVVIVAAMATWILTPDVTDDVRRGRPRPAVRAGHDRQPRRLRAVDGATRSSGSSARRWCWPSRPSRAWPSARISKIFNLVLRRASSPAP